MDDDQIDSTHAATVAASDVGWENWFKTPGESNTEAGFVFT